MLKRELQFTFAYLKDAMRTTFLNHNLKQLRVHCAAAGCPIVADRLYGTALPGQQLHLQSHAITLPLQKTKPPIHAEAPPPPHMVDLLRECGYKAAA